MHRTFTSACITPVRRGRSRCAAIYVMAAGASAGGIAVLAVLALVLLWVVIYPAPILRLVGSAAT